MPIQLQVTRSPRPVLLIGGSGLVGREAAKRLRARWPQVPILVGGRDLPRAKATAAALDNARGVAIDLGRRDLGLPANTSVSTVTMFVKDETLNGQLFAEDRGAGFVDISSAAFEIGPQVAFQARNPRGAPVLLASNWLAGTSTFAALDLARPLARVDRVVVSALLDEQDIGGPAAEADYVRQTQATPSGLVRTGGRFAWVKDADAVGTFEAVDGRRLEARAFGNLDVLSLSAATDAPDVVFQFAVGESSSRRAGGRFSHEIVIDVEGSMPGGRSARMRRAVVHPEGQAPMTALGVSLAIEALAGRDGGGGPGPGLHFPHAVVDAAHAVAALKSIGTRIFDTSR